MPNLHFAELICILALKYTWYQFLPAPGKNACRDAPCDAPR